MGSPPKDIVIFYKEKLKKLFNGFRYLYDINQISTTNIALGRFENRFKPTVDSIVAIINRLYSHWVTLKNEKFKGQVEKALYTIYPKNQQEAQKKNIQTYMDAIDPYERDADGKKQLKAGITQEYLDFYDMRLEVINFIKELLFTETMACEVIDTEDKTHFISINILRSYLPSAINKAWYAEDCFSQSIQELLQNQKGLKTVKVVVGGEERDSFVRQQKGTENFIAYHSEHHINHKINLLPIIVLNTGMGVLERERSILGSQPFFALLTMVASELDFLHDTRVSLETAVLDDSLYYEERQLKHESFTAILDYLMAQESLATNPELKTYNNQYFNTRNYATRASHPNSFYQQLVIFIEDKLYMPNEETSTPFLKTHYNSEKYQALKRDNSPQTTEEDASLFQTYLFGLDSILLVLDENQVIVPVHEDNGAASVYFPKYNANLRRIKELDDKSKMEELDFLEKLERQQKQSQNTFIRSIFVR